MGMHRQIKPNLSVATSGTIDVNEEESYRGLASGVLLQAAEDWACCLRRMEPYWEPGKPENQYRIGGDSSLTEIRRFLRSGYGATICGIIDLDSEVVLEKLEEMLRRFLRNGKAPKNIREGAHL